MEMKKVVVLVFMVIGCAGLAWGEHQLDGVSGVSWDFGITQIYQANVKGGLSTHSRRGRYTGSYDFELSGDLEKLMGAEGLRFYMLVEGYWPRAGGIDPSSVGSFFGTNNDAYGNRAIEVTELWFERSFSDGTLLLRVGKMDLTGGFECHGCPVAFDTSLIANDETTQFLNPSLVNNPAIPFPDYGLGVSVYYNPVSWWYIAGAVADAQADRGETGFNTTFHGPDYFFSIFETGVTPTIDSAKGPLQGAYRIGIWNDPRDKANSAATRTYRGDTGFYLSCDQMLKKENPDTDDSQGLGVFCRYGYAHSARNDLTNFWSAGVQYEGLFEGRDQDVLACGFAQGFFSDKASSVYTEDYESLFEVYYNAAVTERLNITPSLQYIVNPGGDRTVSDTVVVGIRAQMLF